MIPISCLLRFDSPLNVIINQNPSTQYSIFLKNNIDDMVIYNLIIIPSISHHYSRRTVGGPPNQNSNYSLSVEESLQVLLMGILLSLSIVWTHAKSNETCTDWYIHNWAKLSSLFPNLGMQNLSSTSPPVYKYHKLLSTNTFEKGNKERVQLFMCPSISVNLVETHLLFS